MAEYFSFKSDDLFITKNTTDEERRNVTHWQGATPAYEFSFHTMHDAGWPVYIIEPGQRGQRNRPKINIKDKAGTDLSIIGNNLPSPSVKGDALGIVRDNLDLLKKLAKDYYEGVAVASRVADTWLVEWICTSPNCKNKKSPRKVLVEVDGDERYLEAEWFKEFKMGALGKCKICKTRSWEFVEVRAKTKNEKVDIPLSRKEDNAQT